MSFLRTKIFKKLFFMYSVIITLVIMFLLMFITYNIKKTITNNQIFINQKIVEDVNDYFNQQYLSFRNSMNNLYSNSLEIRDTINFLDCSYENYLKNRLDIFYKLNGISYDSIDSFVRNCFSYNRNVDNVIFYSYTSDCLTIFDSSGRSQAIKDVGKGEKSYESLESILINALNSKSNSENYYYIINVIRDPISLRDKGILIIKYNLDAINSIMGYYKKSNNTVMVLKQNGQVIYDSSGKYNHNVYPYTKQLVSSNQPIYLDDYSYVNTAVNAVDTVVVGILPVSSTINEAKLPIVMSYVLAGVLVIIAEIFIYFKVKKLSQRVENVTTAMDKVQKGNFSVQIEPDGEKDEISLISNSFNNMCRRLDEYINRVYLSEIKQKNAEMLALQNQINPHFLYNTLESIRMKAISDGNRDVGKMLYNLALLFRNMVKGDSRITIEQELKYCRLYLDLFKFRYEDRLKYSIDVDVELLENEIVKFTIQPLVENYIVHGIRQESDSNFILIAVRKNHNNVVIIIEDNGKGIEPEKVQLINESMKNSDKTNSLGLINVNERIKYYYGKDYGIVIENGSNGGTKAILTIPRKEVDKDV